MTDNKRMYTVPIFGLTEKWYGVDFDSLKLLLTLEGITPEQQQELYSIAETGGEYCITRAFAMRDNYIAAGASLPSDVMRAVEEAKRQAGL